MKKLFVLIIFFCPSFLVLADDWFYVELKLLSTGENQPQKELGTYGAEIPPAVNGSFKRKILINNETRKKKNEVDLKLYFRIEKDENEEEHLLLTSEAKPLIGKEEKRFRDILLKKGASNLVELFYDNETGTNIIAYFIVKTFNPYEEDLKKIKVVFKCKTTKLEKDKSEVIDIYELQAVGDESVNRKVITKIPVLEENFYDFNEEKVIIKDISSSETPVSIKAGESFSYKPPKKEIKKVKNKIDKRIPAVYQKIQDEKEKDDSSKEKSEKVSEEGSIENKKDIKKEVSFRWEEEEISYELKVLEVIKDKIKVNVKIEGRLYSKEKNEKIILNKVDEITTFVSGQINLFKIGDEERGFELSVQAVY